MQAPLCATGCKSLPYLIGKAVGHEMCGEITETGSEVKDFHVGDRVAVCSVMPAWRSLEAQAGMAKEKATTCTEEPTIPTGRLVR